MSIALRSHSLSLTSRLSATRTLASFAQTNINNNSPLPNTPFVIKPSSQEIKNKALGARNLEAAVRHVHRDGLVVVEDVVPHDHLDHLNKKMVQDARTLQSRGKDGPSNYNQGNLQQDAPPVAEFFYPSIFISTSFPPPPPPPPLLPSSSISQIEPFFKLPIHTSRLPYLQVHQKRKEENKERKRLTLNL